MLFPSWLLGRNPSHAAKNVGRVRVKPGGFRLRLEALEDRVVLSFASPVIVSGSGTTPIAPAVVADVNKDGKPDLITLQRQSASGYVFLNNGNGTFAPRSFFDHVTPAAIAVGDVNGDGNPDIVLANINGGGSPTSGVTYAGSVTVLLGNGQGGFTPATPSEQYILQAPASSIALADVDGDGKLDIVAAPASGGKVFVARSNGYGSFKPAQSYFIPQNPFSFGSPKVAVAVGDINGDGKPDIVVSDPYLKSVSVLLNNGNGTFGTPLTSTVGGTPTALAVRDVSGDGKLDVVTANSNGTVSVLVGLGNSTFGASQNYAIGGPANSLGLGDFNHDGRLDIATTGGTEMDVLLNTGTGTFAAYQKVGPAGSAVVAADFNGDGYSDLAQIDPTSASLAILYNNADWAIPSMRLSGNVTKVGGMVAAHFNGHGYSDLAQIDPSSTGIEALYNNADWLIPGKRSAKRNLDAECVLCIDR